MIRSSFAEFQIALRGLTVAQSNIQVSAHNISNASTVGYSRQYTKQSATTPFSSGSVGMWGTGAEVTDVLQHRSTFLDTQFRAKSSVLGQYTIKSAQLSATEVTFDALGDSGLTSQIDTFFNAMEELSLNPESLTTRNNTITELQSIVDQISTIGTQLQEQQKSVNQEVLTVVDSINSIGKQIASLNQQIKISEANGSQANDLRDQRNLLLDELSGYVNIKVTETQKNKDYDENDPTSGASNLELSVQINGYDFISGNNVNTLQCVKRNSTNQVNEMDAAGLYDIEFAGSGLEFDIYSSTLSGELKGLIDIRDGNNGTATMTYDALLGKSVLTGSETPMPDSTDLTTYPLGADDPQYIADLAKYADVDPTEYSSNAEFVTAVVDKGVRGNNATRTLTTDTYKGLPHYMNKLNNFIRTFALSMNEGLTFDTSDGYGKNATKTDSGLESTAGHINSYDLNGNQGQLLLTFQSGGVYQTTGAIDDYTNINFNNFYINPNIADDPSLLACSDSADGEVGNANAVQGYIDLKDNTKLFKEGTYQSYLIAMSGELGIVTEQAVSFEESYFEMQTLTENQRLSVSGVDTNEEMVTLTKNQQLYEASAKLISVLSSIYATCIDLGL